VRLNVVAMRVRAVSVLLALVMGFLLVTLDAGPVYACSCADVPLKNDIRDADAVFSGEVRSIDEEAFFGGGPMAAPGRITFAVQDSWKEVKTETADVYGQGDGVNCYNLFEEGEAYLVYASRAKEADAPLKNVACGETKPLVSAEADLRMLGPPADGLPETGGLAPLPIGGTLLAMGVLSFAAACTVRVLSRPPRH
jgi:hypothetical protein